MNPSLQSTWYSDGLHDFHTPKRAVWFLLSQADRIMDSWSLERSSHWWNQAAAISHPPRMSQDSFLFICFTQSDTATLLKITKEKEEKRNKQQQKKPVDLQLKYWSETWKKLEGTVSFKCRVSLFVSLPKGCYQTIKDAQWFAPASSLLSLWQDAVRFWSPAKEGASCLSIHGFCRGSYFPAFWQGWRESKNRPG